MEKEKNELRNIVEQARHNKLKVIPFRIKTSELEDDYSDVYEFLIKGTNKNAYQIKINIDSLNDLGRVFESCTCPHHKFRGEECKHIKKCKEILREFGVIYSQNVHNASEEEKNGN